ncbi:hypothetical protein [Prevotellamassilia timonensis]|uniref:hypothetical protein n=1 Tax=Prevotellamassilia timonensis TaxID=1852370 RepID=UPI001F2A5B9D|nr:hypothetical protein [Prevotellamassilia timonensis]MCF2634119.1 hypothetical protein [Prevotellamassilia timonensis]
MTVPTPAERRTKRQERKTKQGKREKQSGKREKRSGKKQKEENICTFAAVSRHLPLGEAKLNAQNALKKDSVRCAPTGVTTNL